MIPKAWKFQKLQDLKARLFIALNNGKLKNARIRQSNYSKLEESLTKINYTTLSNVVYVNSATLITLETLPFLHMLLCSGCCFPPLLDFSKQNIHFIFITKHNGKNEGKSHKRMLPYRKYRNTHGKRRSCTSKLMRSMKVYELLMTTTGIAVLSAQDVVVDDNGDDHDHHDCSISTQNMSVLTT